MVKRFYIGGRQEDNKVLYEKNIIFEKSKKNGFSCNCCNFSFVLEVCVILSNYQSKYFDYEGMKKIMFIKKGYCSKPSILHFVLG